MSSFLARILGSPNLATIAGKEDEAQAYREETPPPITIDEGAGLITHEQEEDMSANTAPGVSVAVDDDEQQENDVIDHPTAGSEKPPLTRNQKKCLRRKIREKEKKALAAKSLTLNLPCDPLDAERQACLKTLTARFSAFPYLSQMKPGDVLGTYQDQRRMLEEFEAHIVTELKALHDRTVRPEVRHISQGALIEEIRELEAETEPREELIQWKLSELLAMRSVENQKIFATAMKELLEKVTDRLDANEKALRQARDWERRRIIIERLMAILKSFDPDFEMPEDTPVKNDVLDISGEVSAVLFQPQNCVHRLERMFKIIVEPQHASQNAAQRSVYRVSENEPYRTRTNPRQIVIWGFPQNLAAVTSFIKEADFSGSQRKTYARKLIPAIIGRGGIGLRSLEAEFNCLLDIDKNSDVVVLGIPDAADKVFAKIDSTRIEQQETNTTTDLPLDINLARAIQQNYAEKLRALEGSFKGTIRVYINQQEGTARINVRARSDVIGAAVNDVQEQILNPLQVFNFSAPVRALNRLFIPPRSTGLENVTPVKLLYEEFQTMRNTLGLYITRSGGPSPRTRNDDENNTTARSPQSGAEMANLIVVCNQAGAASVKERVEDLLKRANYVTTRITIEREQLNVFTPENRALIEHSSGIRFSHFLGNTGNRTVGANPRGRQEAQLILQGTEEEIESAKKIVEEILIREGSTQTIQFEDNLLINSLISERGARVRELESTFGITISLFRDTNSARLIGHQTAVEDAAEELRKIDKEIHDERAKLKTIRIPVASRSIGRILGRGGANIRQIRVNSGVRSIQIEDGFKPGDEQLAKEARPEGDEMADSEVIIADKKVDEPMSCVVVIGDQACVESASMMINQIVLSDFSASGGRGNGSNRSSGPLNSMELGGVGRGRGRGRNLGGSEGITGGVRPTSVIQGETSPAKGASDNDVDGGLWDRALTAGLRAQAQEPGSSGRQLRPSFKDENQFPSLAAAGGRKG